MTSSRAAVVLTSLQKHLCKQFLEGDDSELFDSLELAITTLREKTEEGKRFVVRYLERTQEYVVQDLQFTDAWVSQIPTNIEGGMDAAYTAALSIASIFENLYKKQS